MRALIAGHGANSPPAAQSPCFDQFAGANMVRQYREQARRCSDGNRPGGTRARNGLGASAGSSPVPRVDE
jgi:hypothetical protein